MGLFLSALIVQNASEEDVKKSLEKAGNDYPDWYLVSEECQYQKCGSGVKVLLSDMCCGYEDIPKEISRNLCVLFYYVTSTMAIIGVTSFMRTGKN